MQIAASSQTPSDKSPRHSRPFALRPIAYCVMLACCDAALANPIAPQVINGAASFAQPDARTLNVTNSPGAIIHWQGFSIGANEITRFTQQSASSAVLNRVVGADISRIQGQLLSNGRVFLINPAGILIGGGAIIDTAGFVGSSLNMTNADFLAGKLKFDGANAGTVRNEGTIKASGDIYLVGPMVENAGAIRSENGNVVLAAGKSVTITSPDLDGVQFTLQAPSDTALNLGTIDAKNAVAMFAGTLKHSGDTRAGGLSVDAGGNIVLVAQKDLTIDSGSHLTASGTSGGNVTVQSGGTTLVSGAIDAQGSAGKGGTVHLLGDHVGVMDAATVDVSGDTGGGTILVGGDLQGRNPSIQNAEATYISAAATLKADAARSGDGGKVVVWSDGPTRAYGAISAKGGAQSGDGGFVETSGHYLDVTRAPDVSAPAGHGGSWLIDPASVTVFNGAGGDTVAGTPNGPFTPAGGTDSLLSSTTLNTAVNANATVTISTVGDPGAGPGNIVFDASINGDITITKPPNTITPDTTLVLNAAGDILFRGGSTTFQTTQSAGAHTLTLQLNPVGRIVTEGTGTTTLIGDGLAVVAQVMNGKTWTNDGTINLQGTGGVATPSSINLYDGTHFATLENNNTINIVSASGAGTGAGVVIASDATQKAGVFDNPGTVQVNQNTTFGVQFINGATGAVDINNSNTVLTLQNGRTVQGTIAINGTGAQLLISENHPDVGGVTPIGPTFLNTAITGTQVVNISNGSADTAASFNGVTATNTTLTVGNHADARITGASTFGAVNIPLLTNSGKLTVDALLTIGGALTLGGGTLTGIGALTGNTLAWSGGVVAGTGLKSFSGGITTAAAGTRILTGKLGLTGTGSTWTVPAGVVISQQGADSQVILSNGAGITNNGTWTIAAGASHAHPIDYGSGAAVVFFDNAGTFSKDSDGTADLFANGPTTSVFSNTNTVNVNKDQLTLRVGRTAGDSGTYNVAIGAAVGDTTTLEFNGSRTLSGDVAATGGGSGTALVRFASGDIAVSNAFSIASSSLSQTEVTAADVAFNTGAAPLTFAGGLTLSGGADGSITGSDAIQVDGPFVWSSGALTQTAGTPAFTTTGATTISGPAMLNGRAWTNTAAGSVDMTTATSQLTMSNGAVVNNDGGWTLTSGTTTPIKNGGGTTTIFNNGGTFTKSATAPATQSIDTVFRNINPGTVEIDDGVLALGPQQLLSPDTGIYNLNASTSVLQFNNGRTLDAGSNIAGAGEARFNGGIVSVQGDYSPARTTIQNSGTAALFDATGGGTLTLTGLTLSGGTLGGAMDLATSGTFNWSGGRMVGGAGSSFSTGAGSTTNITGPVTLDTRSFTNDGTVNQSGSSGQMTFANAAVATNNATRAWHVSSSSTTPFKDDGNGTATAFDNQGSLDFSANVDRTLTVGTFTNTNPGTTIVNNGILRMPAGGTDTGRYNVGIPSAELVFEGDRTLGAGSNIDGPGIVRFRNGIVTLQNDYDLSTSGTTFIEGGTAVFSTAGGLLTFGGNQLSISGGELDGTSDMTINSALDWSGGRISGPAGSILTTNGPATSVISGPVTLDTRTWNNAGPLNEHGLGQLTLTNSVVNNQGAAVWTINTDGAPLAGNGTFINDATLRNTGTTAHVVSAATFRNQDLVDVLGGSLTVTGGGNQTGTFDVADGASLAFTGNPIFQNGSIITGAGTASFSGTETFQSGARVDGLGTFALTAGGATFQNGAVYTGVGTTAISGGSLVLNGVAADTNILDLSGTAVLQSGSMRVNTGGTWSGGVLLNTVFHVAPAATFNLTGTGQKTANDTSIINEGTTNLADAGDLRLNNGSVFDNVGTFDIQANADVATQGAVVSTFSNAGVLNKSGGGGTSVIASRFENTHGATTHVSSGTLQVTGSFATNDGTIKTEPLTTFSTNGAALTNSATGTIMGKGTMDVPLLTNNGVVSPGASPGTLVINGDYTQGPDGVLAIELAGPVRGVSYDLLQVAGTANLGGTLHVVTSGGYVPVGGETFTFLTYTGHTGDFATTIYPDPSFQGSPGATGYATTFPAGAAGGNGGTRTLVVDENERLRENFINLGDSNRDAETERKTTSREVCN